MIDKTALRREMRKRLRELGEARRVKSEAICRALVRQPAYLAAERVAVFDAMPSEPSLEALWQLAPRAFYFPRVQGEELEFVAVPNLGELIAPVLDGRYREPAAGEPLKVEELDLVVVPGLAFTRAGERLGRGGGYYDRLLARLPARVATIGVCFDLQVVVELPLEPHDRCVQQVITEAGVWPAVIPSGESPRSSA